MENNSGWAQRLKYGSLVIEMGTLVLVGMIGGWYLDNHFSTTPWMMVTGLAVGLIGASWTLFRLIKILTQKPPPAD